MPELSEKDVGPSVIDELKIGGRVMRLERPAVPEQILDLGVVADAYKLDEYMPYWAALWPVATGLARLILEESWAPGLKAIELGCGLGLPGIAALMAGMHVTLTDYDETALRFAERNARHNGVDARLRTMALDWRAPLDERFDLIIASDLIYEARNVEPLIALFAAMLAPNGEVLAADQNRAHALPFQKALTAAGFVWTSVAWTAEATGGARPEGTLYRIKRRGA